MLTWMRKLLNTNQDAEQMQRLWTARVEALEDVLGKCDGTVCHAPTPLHREGCADVLRFRTYVNGLAYVTCSLIGNEKQLPNKWGHYEVVMCTRQESEWAPMMLSRLAAYTYDATLHPGDTMDIAALRPPDSSIAALLFARPDPPADSFTVLGSPANLILCIGITSAEFSACKNFGSGVMLRMLKDNQIYPFTVLDRASVA
jgi:hypothetical protein